jgi:PAS domain S-box-containing protein
MRAPDSIPSGLANAILEAAPYGVLITDVRADEPGPTILYANPAFCAMTGYRLEEIVGRSPRFLQGPRSSQSVLNRLRLALLNDTDFQGETTNYRADGTPFLMQWTVSRAADNSGTPYFFAFQRDVTEERQLEAIAAGRHLSKSLGSVFSGLRHEIGNPVNSIKTALEFLNERLPETSLPRIKTTLVSVLDELGRIEYLLHEFKSFNAFENPKPETIDLAIYLEKIIVRLRSSEPGTSVSLVLGPGTPTHPSFDPRVLQQVLINLLANAFDAVRGVGIGDGAPNVEIRVSGAGRGWTLEISDDGPPIAAETRAKLFRPFFTTKPHGSGIGLALTRRMVERLGGTVRFLEDMPRNTFQIWLPLAPAALGDSPEGR